MHMLALKLALFGTVFAKTAAFAASNSGLLLTTTAILTITAAFAA